MKRYPVPVLACFVLGLLATASVAAGTTFEIVSASCTGGNPSNSNLMVKVKNTGKAPGTATVSAKITTKECVKYDQKVPGLAKPCLKTKTVDKGTFKGTSATVPAGGSADVKIVIPNGIGEAAVSVSPARGRNVKKQKLEAFIF